MKECNELRKKIKDFFIKNPYPDDKKFHKFAEEIGVDEHKLEAEVYGILSAILTEGKSVGKDMDIDEKTMKKGIKVEMEHTNCPMLAEKIVKDHLVESKDYYEYLEKMEKQIEKDKSDNKMKRLKELSGVE